MKCSVYAAQYFLEGLFNNGCDQEALDLMLADGDRSWKHMVNSGTTITWEAWDLKYKPNQDWNHAWGAAPANLLPRFVLGVQTAAPGWTVATIRPCPSGLKYALGKVPTPRGPIEVDWKNENAFKISIVLPDGVSAKVELPATENSSGVFSDGGQIAASKVGARWILNEEVSGSNTLEVR